VITQSYIKIDKTQDIYLKRDGLFKITAIDASHRQGHTAKLAL